jgi:hypothetical protein
MNSFLKNFYAVNYTINKYYMTCCPMDENGQPELNSEYLIHSKTGNMITYRLDEAFSNRMNKAIANQEPPIIKCSEELLSKYVNSSILIAKYKDYYCSLPIISRTNNYNQGSESFTADLADQSILSINPVTSEIFEYSNESEIMADIIRQIEDIKEKTLKQF